MSFTLLQSGDELWSMNTAGELSASALTLPTGVSLRTDRPPRFARFKRYAILVNTPTSPLMVAEDGHVMLLTPAAPSAAVVLSNGASGTLSGTYLARQTYRVYDGDGNLVSESGYSPDMTDAFTIASKKLHAAFGLSSQFVSATQLYRTTTGGSVYFPWHKVDGNVVTSYEGQESDDDLGTIAAADLGSAPNDLQLITQWQGRLWGTTASNPDNLRFTESGTSYAWSSLNDIPIGRIGDDSLGVTALIPRRNSLGVAKSSQFCQITGTTRTNHSQTNLSDQHGCDSQETVAVFRDTAFFLWHDGVYTWDDSGFRCISDEANVRSWFATDTYFNRSLFTQAFAVLDTVTLRYKLFLCSAGQSTVDRWVEYDLLTRRFYGPHRTDAFTPSSAFLTYNTKHHFQAMIGSSTGYCSVEQTTRNDWDVNAIAMRVITKLHDAGYMDLDKYFGMLSMFIRNQGSGTATITPTVDEIERAAISYLMTLDRRTLGRIGEGKTFSLEIANSELNKDVVIDSYLVDPVNLVGRR